MKPLIIIFILLTSVTNTFSQSYFKTDQTPINIENSVNNIIFTLSSVNKFKIAQGKTNEKNKEEIIYPYNCFEADYTYFLNSNMSDAIDNFKTDSNTVGQIVSNFYINPTDNLPTDSLYNRILRKLKYNSGIKNYFEQVGKNASLFIQKKSLNFNAEKSLTESQLNEMNTGFASYFEQYEICIKLSKNFTVIDNPYDINNPLNISFVKITAWLQAKKPVYPKTIAGVEIDNINYLEYSNSIYNKKLLEVINKNRKTDIDGKPVLEDFNYELGAIDWNIVNLKEFYSYNLVSLNNKTKCELTQNQINNATNITTNLYAYGENTGCFDKNTAGIFLGKKLFDLIENNETFSLPNFTLKDKLIPSNYYLKVNGYNSNIGISAKTIKIKLASNSSNSLPNEEVYITYVNNPNFSLILKVELVKAFLSDEESEILYKLENVIFK